MSQGAGCQKQGRLMILRATAGQLLRDSLQVMVHALGAHASRAGFESRK
jgi:hypothetical protein